MFKSNIYTWLATGSRGTYAILSFGDFEGISNKFQERK